MSKQLQKRIITSLILFLSLLFFYFSNFFFIGLAVITLIIQLEFNFMFQRIFGRTLKKGKTNFKSLFLSILTIVYIIIAFDGSAILLHGVSGSPFFLLFILSICFCSDIGGYVIGKSIGGKKLTSISPNKTISGSIGSFFFSILPLVIFNYFDQYEYSYIFNNFLLCLIISLVCQAGDLFISYIKRKAKIKDTGAFLPGHGGILDRLDGVIFAIPFSYFYLNGFQEFYNQLKIFFL